MNEEREKFLSFLTKKFPELLPYWSYVELMLSETTMKEKFTIKNVLEIYCNRKIIMGNSEGFKKKPKALVNITEGRQGKYIDLAAVRSFARGHKEIPINVIVEHLYKSDLPDMNYYPMIKYLKKTFIKQK